MEPAHSTNELYIELASQVIQLREAMLQLSGRFDSFFGLNNNVNVQSDIDDIESINIEDYNHDADDVQLSIEEYNKFMEIAPTVFPVNNEFFQTRDKSCSSKNSTSESISSIRDPDNLLDQSNVEIDDHMPVVYCSFSDILGDVPRSDNPSICNSEPDCNQDSIATQCILPYLELNDDVFQYFSAHELELSTDFTHDFGNRKSVYYGVNSYSYGNITHQPKDITENNYLVQLLNYVDVVYPHFSYNSAMVHLYASGENFIPHHSDNEQDIFEDSVILTISLGATRTMEFMDKNSELVVESVALRHGSCLTMTTLSQSYFSHSIPSDQECAGSRNSVTLRLIKSDGHSSLSTITSDDAVSQVDYTDSKGVYEKQPSSYSFDTDGYQPPEQDRLQSQKTHQKTHHRHYHDTSTPSPGKATFNNQKVDTLYISSSLFRDLDETMLSSSDQKAKVFFFPGANSSQMLNRLLQNPDFKSLNRSNIRKVFLLTGTNYVDSINSRTTHIDTAIHGIFNIISALWSIFNHAQFNIINLFPRVDGNKNNIVYLLNREMRNICSTHGLNFVDTEYQNRLFSRVDGSRKDVFFKVGYDNVHFNKRGISRLGKHLKYLAHNGKVA